MVELWGSTRRAAWNWPPASRCSPGSAYRTRADFAATLEDAVEVMQRRQQSGCAGSPGCTNPPPAEPLIVILIDELAALTGYVTTGRPSGGSTTPSGCCCPRAGRSASSVVGGHPGPAQGDPAGPGPVPDPDRAAADRGRTGHAWSSAPAPGTAAPAVTQIPHSLPGVGFVQVDGDRRTGPGPLRLRHRRPHPRCSPPAGGRRVTAWHRGDGDEPDGRSRHDPASGATRPAADRPGDCRPAVRAELRAQIVPGWGAAGGVRVSSGSIRTGGSPRPTTPTRRSPAASASPARSAGPASPTPSPPVSRTGSGAASMSPNGPGCGSPWPRAPGSQRSSTRTPGRRRPDVSRRARRDHHRHGPRNGRQRRGVHPAGDETGLRPRHRHRDPGCRSPAAPPGKRSAHPAPAKPGCCGCSNATRAGTATPNPTSRPRPSTLDQADDEDQADDDDGSAEGSRRVRSTRRRSDAPDLPQVPMADRTVGRTFATPDGKEYRPSMFLTLTLPSYGADPAGHRAAGRPGHAMTTGGPRWTRCTSRSWSTGSGRTCAGAPATGCSTSPPSNPKPDSPRTCTPRCAASSPGRCSSR